MPKITIIGTSHIAKTSIEQVRKTIENEKPDCVAVELCPARYYSLLEGERKPSLKYGLTQFLLSFLQQYLGKKLGVLPGAEMLTAVDAAQQAGSKIILIDMRIEEIIEKINNVSIFEKFKLFSKLFSGFLFSALQFVPQLYHFSALKFVPQLYKTSPFSKDSFDISKVPEGKLIKKAMNYMKKDLPVFYDILVAQRNEYMARNIEKLSKQYKKIIVVVGAGHKDGLERLLKRKK